MTSLGDLTKDYTKRGHTLTAPLDPRDLEAMADWKADLASRFRRAELRFEFASIGELQELAEEQDQLAAEVASFKAVAHGLRELMKGCHGG